MSADPAPVQEVHAGPHWRQVDFISDLHLHPGDLATARIWREYLASTPAQALFILGDLFEAWPGDDCATAPGFANDCAHTLRQTADRIAVFFLHGNRDFLVGPQLADHTGLRLLADPTVLVFNGLRVLLSHGDALCLGDTDYLRFRAQVRAPGWADAFLARPLAEREAVARQMRAQSQARQGTGPRYTDVDAPLAQRWLQAANAEVLVHGHTHQPGEHDLGEGRRRIVLSDWDVTDRPARAQVLRLMAGGQFERMNLDAAGD